MHIIYFYIMRPIKRICGFSRETVIAVTTNIEGIEYRRQENERIQYKENLKSLWRKLVR